ncbi:hypothetical protein KCH_76520 [Kitasatospora cheerisanensis KCTC 2395]|uniref:Uncharacterized protein n=1 Tax=Kitasatospora cheerisanensis KCTC 2395 TaxID=1348663 RepID=A0A066YGI6_9ACTN|nr:hypothetical protein KCH_76520 [Kitasatospora cheerisanensis KCTC 2395]
MTATPPGDGRDDQDRKQDLAELQKPNDNAPTPAVITNNGVPQRRPPAAPQGSGLNLSVNGGDRMHDAVDGDLVAYDEPWGPSRR